MKKIQFYCLLVVFCLLLACGGKQNEEVSQTEVTDDKESRPMENPAEAMGKLKLTDDLIKNYMVLVPKLKEKGASLSADMGKIEGLYQYNQMEGLIKENGFKDLNEFIMVHTKIAYGFAANEMKEQNAEQKMEDVQTEGIKAIEKSLKDPNISAEQKQILEMTLQQLKGNGQENTIKSIMDSYKQMVSEEETDLVKKHTADLKKIYEQINGN